MLFDLAVCAAVSRPGCVDGLWGVWWIQWWLEGETRLLGGSWGHVWLMRNYVNSDK